MHSQGKSIWFSGPTIYLVLAVGSLYIFWCSIIDILKTPPEPKYVSAISDNVTFAVLPFNDYLSQVKFAADVESVLVNAGLNVVALSYKKKEIEERKGAGLAQTGGTSDISVAAVETAEKQALRIEKYTEVEATKADYFVKTILSDNYGSVKIAERNDRNVIGVVNVYSGTIGKDLLPYLEELKIIRKVPLDNQTKKCCLTTG